VSRFDTWVKRFRTLGEHKTHERVLTHDKYEILTSTQACRFKQLQGMRIGRKETARAAAPAKPHYPLPEACARLDTTVSEMLLSAAANDFRCFVLAAGLRGRWQVSGPEDSAPSTAIRMPQYLALTPADCRDIESNGSVNVSEFEYPSDGSPTHGGPRAQLRFRLVEPLWVDPQRIVLRHPLPERCTES
jgi:hypothetical protein